MKAYDKINEIDRGGAFTGGMDALVRGAKISFAVLIVVILVLLVRFASTGGYIAVKPQEAIIVFRFGKYLDTYTKGNHWFLPYPVTRFVAIRTAPQQLSVTFQPGAALVKAEEDAGAFLVPGRDHYILTGDSGMLHSAWTIVYHIANPRDYYLHCLTPANPMADDEVFMYSPHESIGTRGPQTQLRNFFQQAVIAVSGHYTVNDIVYEVDRRNAYIQEVQKYFSDLVEKANIGVSVDNVLLDSVAPPNPAKMAFNAVALARSQSEAAINEAQTYSATAANDAESSVATVIADAEAYRSQIVSEVRAESVYFQQILKQYKENPDTVLMTLYNNTLREVLSSENGKYLIASPESSGRQVRIKLNPEPRRAVPQEEAQK